MILHLCGLMDVGLSLTNHLEFLQIFEGIGESSPLAWKISCCNKAEDMHKTKTHFFRFCFQVLLDGVLIALECNFINS